MPQTIDCTPSWVFAAKVYIAVLENKKASAEAKKTAKLDLMNMAKVADKYNESIKTNNKS